MRLFGVRLVVTLAAALFISSCTREHDWKSAAAQIQPEAVRAHMAFLTDDLLEGRLAGSRGYDIAARYVASQFDSLGLEPAANAGWFQSVPLERIEPPVGEMTVIRQGRLERLRSGADFVVNAYAANPKVSSKGPAVFGGFCVSVPELGYDDFAKTDVQGAILVCLEGAPARLPSAIRAHYGGIAKMEAAANHGARGLITLHVGEAERVYSFQLLLLSSRMPDYRWLDADGKPADGFPSLAANAILSEQASRRLFQYAPRSFDQVMADAQAGKQQSFPLGIDLEVTTTSGRQAVASANVIGAIRGSDAKLRSEYVVYTAHLDHLGIGPPVDGDSTYNGAMDNAAGIAGLIETARAFKSLAHAPRRSILFVATTGEDAGLLGLLGSDYFARTPTVPRSSLVANINIDGLPIFFDFRDVVAYGAEHSSLDGPVRKAAAMLGLDVIPDPWPEQGMFVRGDQYSFVRQGIPSVWISMGFKAADPRIDAKKIVGDYMAHRYHQPKDDMNQQMDFNGATRGIRMLFLTGDIVANLDNRPIWKEDDPFPKIFGSVQTSQR